MTPHLLELVAKLVEEAREANQEDFRAGCAHAKAQDAREMAWKRVSAARTAMEWVLSEAIQPGKPRPGGQAEKLLYSLEAKR